MKALKLIIPIMGLLALTACNSGSSGTTTSNGNGTTTTASITGVATAPQISVVTAK